MDLRWQEEQRAFQARVLIADDPDLALRPYRTFVGPATAQTNRVVGRVERLVVLFVTGGVLALALLSVGAPRELAALSASFTGGIALMTAVARPTPRQSRAGWRPLLAVYAPSVLRGARPVCVTQISIDEFNRLGAEGFGTVVGNPRPGATFGLFVDDYLVWPRTPPRGPVDVDPGFGST